MAKTLGISVSAETFGEDFQAKLQKALVDTFGEGTSIKFQDEGGKTEEELAAEEEERRKKEEEMEKENLSLKEKMAELEKTHVNLDMKNKIADYEKNIAELKQKLTEKDTVVQKTSDEFSKYRQDIRKNEIGALIADGEKAGRILPKHREHIRVMLEGADANKVVKFSQDGKDVEKSQWDLVKEYIESLPILVNFAEISKTGEVKIFKETVEIKGETHPVDDAELAVEIETYAQKNNVPLDIAYLKVTELKKSQK